MSTYDSAFWDDLAADLEDPEFLREYLAAKAEIEALDRPRNLP